ncbi:aldose 1-epimerase family protein [soil metagenome]
MDSANVVLRSSDLVAEISPLGAELRRLATVGGLELLSDGDPAFWTGRAPLLFPIVGALRHDEYRLGDARYALPKHGFARRSTFTVVESGPTSALLRLEADAQTHAAYPFEFRLDVRFTLDDTTLTVGATVSNHGEGVMPASFGFHPALRWPLPFGRPRAEHRITFAQDEPAPVRRLNGDGLVTPDPHPTPVRGRTLTLEDGLFVDDALIFDRLASRSVVYGADEGPRIEVGFDGLSLLGVWTKPGAGFICIEPWAGMADPEGFDGDFFAKPGVFQIQSGEARDLVMTMSLIGG